MADSHHIIDGQVVPYHGGRKSHATDSWRDATPLELQLQEELQQAEQSNDTLRAQLEAAERLVVAVEVQAEENFQRAEAAEANAARYEWLRENDPEQSNVFFENSHEELDAAIDAAMSRTKEETK